MQTTKIVLGPLLGVESDNKYTICVLLHDFDLQIHPVLEINGNQFEPVSINKNDKFIEIGYSKKYRFYRFEFDFENETEEHQKIKYSIKYDAKSLLAKSKKDQWAFSVCPKNHLPSFAVVSCNGSHNKYPTEISPKDNLGWKELIAQEPDYLIMMGDQVYADTLLDKKYGVEGVIEFVEDKNDKKPEPDIKKVEDFYIQLYIDSWANEFLALALAQIPNIMTWDDHDIIDGYGSYNDEIQKKLKKVVFEKASKCYELFQIRTLKNTSLLNGKLDYSMCIKIRNYGIVLPDTRSHRSLNNVLVHDQYKVLHANLIMGNLLNLKDGDIICFILPVPIAHRDFTNFIEKGMYYIYDKLRPFNKEGSDDLIDHWDHPYHEVEQRIMLDFIFEVGEKYKPKNLLIVSGDVHSSGIAKITQHLKLNETRQATQIVSSPIVNESSPWMDRIKNLISDDIKTVGNYTCELKNYGTYPKKDFYTRNFIIINEKNAKIFIEEKGGWTGKYNNGEMVRNFNKYK
jgi:hypothetical protein